MFLRMKVEKKIRHYTLSSREWINVLYVTPSSEDPPLGLIDRQSRLPLGSTDTGGMSTEKPLLQRTYRILSMRVAGEWMHCDGFNLEAGIVTAECWVSGVDIVPTSLRVVGTRLHGASVGAMRISSHWSRWTFSNTRGNRAGGGYVYAHSAFSSLTEHLLPWLMDLERGTQIVEVCDSTSLQTDPIMGFPSQCSEDRWV